MIKKFKCLRRLYNEVKMKYRMRIIWRNIESDCGDIPFDIHSEHNFIYPRITYKLAYKAAWNGKVVYKVSRYFPSSKTCSSCGYINKELKLSDRTYICPACGNTMDRDYNAARNILEEGLRCCI